MEKKHLHLTIVTPERTVMADKDVTITHRWKPEKRPTSRSTGTVTGRTAMSVDGKLTSSSEGKAK